MFVTERYFGYADKSFHQWDYLAGYNDAIVTYAPLLTLDNEAVKHHQLRGQTHEEWEGRVPEQNRVHIERLRFIHYDRILAVDEFGDAAHEGPHILVEFDGFEGPFEPYVVDVITDIRPYSHRRERAEPENRVRYFTP